MCGKELTKTIQGLIDKGLVKVDYVDGIAKFGLTEFGKWTVDYDETHERETVTGKVSRLRKGVGGGFRENRHYK